MKKRLCAFLLSGISALFIASVPITSFADSFYLNKSQPGGSSWKTGGDWVNVITGTTGSPASAGNDYYIYGASNMRTPDTSSGTEVFPGSVLYLGYQPTYNETTGEITRTFSTGGIGTKSPFVQYDNLQFGNGTINNSKAPNAVITISGNITINGEEGAFNSFEMNNDSDSRSSVYSALLSGTGSFAVQSGLKGYISFTNSANTFSGTVTVKDAKTTLKLSKGALGTANLTNNGTVVISGDNSAAKVINNASGAKINLTSGADLTVQNMNVTYYSAKGNKTFALPNQTISFTTQAQKEALAVAGLSAADNNSVLTITASRAPATFYMTTATNEGEGWDQNVWATTAGGTASGVTPTFGDTAVVTYLMRTVAAASGTQNFLAKVRIDKNGTLGLKNESNAVVNIPDLVLNGGSIGNAKNNGATCILDGNIRVDADSVINLGSTDTEYSRNIRIRSNISGEKGLSIKGKAKNQPAYNVYLDGDNSGYTGTWTNDSNCIIHASTANALGSGNISNSGTISLEIASNYDNAGADWTNNSGGTFDFTKETVFAGTLTNNKGGKVKAAGNLSVGNLVYKDSLPFEYTLGNQAKVLTPADKAALSKGAGITFTSDTDQTLTIANSNRDTKTFYMATSLSGGDANNWSNTAYYTETKGSTTVSGYVPTFGDTLYIDKSMRTPQIGDGGAFYSFLARTILDAGGELNLKSPKNNIDIYMPFLEMNGGTINHGFGNITINLSGNMLVTNQSTISQYQDADNSRIMILESDISGSENLVLVGKSGNAAWTRENSITLSGQNSAYTGTLISQGLIQVKTNADNALGKTGLTMQGTSSLDIKAGLTEDIENLKIEGTNKVTLNGSMDVDTISRTKSGALTFNMGNTASLAFAAIGDEANPIDMTLAGGTVSILGADGTVFGDFMQTGGTLKLGSDQTLTINGDAKFNKVALFNNDPNFVYDENQFYSSYISDIAGSVDISAVTMTLETQDGTIYNVLPFIQDGTILYGSSANVPEPATWTLLILGIGAMGVFRSRKNRK